MANKVTFDYSKAAAFIHEEEIAGIKAGVQAARETLDGSIFRLIMIKKSLYVFRKQQKRSEKIQKYFL